MAALGQLAFAFLRANERDGFPVHNDANILCEASIQITPPPHHQQLKDVPRESPSTHRQDNQGSSSALTTGPRAGDFAGYSFTELLPDC